MSADQILKELLTVSKDYEQARQDIINEATTCDPHLVPKIERLHSLREEYDRRLIELFNGNNTVAAAA